MSLHALYCLRRERIAIIRLAHWLSDSARHQCGHDTKASHMSQIQSIDKIQIQMQVPIKVQIHMQMQIEIKVQIKVQKYRCKCR